MTLNPNPSSILERGSLGGVRLLPRQRLDLVRVLDLDGSLTSQDLGPVERRDWRELGPRLRYMCTPWAQHGFAKRLAELPPAQVTLLGSGDFHHLSYSLLQLQRQPFSLVLFDQHPDWSALSQLPGCGSWVREALALPMLEKVIIIGVRKADAQRWLVGSRVLRALREGRLELYPYAKTDARTRRTAGRRSGVFQENAGLLERTARPSVEEAGLPAVVENALRRLPTPRVYVSIDKDVLAPRWAFSNWSPGAMQLGELNRALRQIRGTVEVAGVDITGEWSAGGPANRVFRALAELDHPPIRVPAAEELAANAATNRVLLHALGLDL